MPTSLKTDDISSRRVGALKSPARILFMDHTAQMSGGEIALLNLVK
jgi:hypothetical protein